MAQAHGDRLTAVDASFLAQEVENAHMHVGAVLIFEGPPPDYEDFCTQIRSRLHLVPRYRQKLAFPPLETGRPLWVDDPNFNLQYHVRHTALPSPGSEEQLRALAARVHSQRLDRSKPLWETWLVQGLEDNRFALISKTHHALVDGVAGVDLATVLFDAEPVPPAAPHEGEPWAPAGRAERGASSPRAGSRGSCARRSSSAARRCGAAAHPNRSLEAAREAIEGVGEVAWAGPEPRAGDAAQRADRPAPAVRRSCATTWRTSSASRTRSAARSTTSCWRSWPARCASGCARAACAPRAWSCARSCRSRSAPRTSTTRWATGSPRCAGRCPSTSRTRSRGCAVVREAMDGLKDSKQAVGAEVLAGVQSFAPPTVLAQASRINFSTRLFNLIVTNVPGPQFPLYVLGRELQDLFPIAFLPRDHALAIAIMSYNGGMDFGLLGDYDAMPDLDELGRDLEVALEELLIAAKKATKAQGPQRRAAAPRRPRPPSATSVAERELRVLGHLVRGPRRREDHVRHDLLDALDLAHELLHLLGDLGADRACGGGQREGHGHRAAVDLDAVDQPELHEVEPQLGIDHVAERLGDVFFVDHRPRV